MRRREPENSSFDLFLDAICNTFGGIVFLAILLAILIQTRSIVSNPTPSDQPPSTPDEVRQLTVALDAVTAEYARLTIALEATPLVAERSPEDAEYQELVAGLESRTEELTDVTDRQIAATPELTKLLASNARLQEENNRVPAELRAVQTRVDQKSAALRELVADQQQTLQLPLERSSNAASVLLLLKNGRVYLARKPNLFGRGFNDQHVATQDVLAGGKRITAKPNAGWQLNSVNGRAEVDRLLRDAVANGHIITIAVWPDSYDDFAEIKSEMVSVNLDYQLWPQADNEPLILYFNAGDSRVQ